MMHCDECGVGFSGDLTHCPLCGNLLDGNPAPPVFPIGTVQHASKAAKRFLAALTVLCLAVIVVGGNLLGASALSMLALSAAVVIAYVFVRNLVLHTPDILRVAERYFLVLLAFCIIWFLATGNSVATTYVIPFICLTATLFNTVLLVVQRGAFVAGYAKYLIYNIVLGIVPIVFVFTGIVYNPVPSYISAAAAIALGLVLAITARKQSADEARKLFSL